MGEIRFSRRSFIAGTGVGAGAALVVGKLVDGRATLGSAVDAVTSAVGDTSGGADQQTPGGAEGDTPLEASESELTATRDPIPETAVTRENARAGSTDWRLTNPPGDDLKLLSGYCRLDSVMVGDSIGVHVVVIADRVVRGEVYRLGWYGGDGARLLVELSATTVKASPPIVTDTVSGLGSAAAQAAFEISVEQDWLSGIYVVRLIDEEGFDAHVTFVVRDHRAADVVMIQPILTYAAYSNTPTPHGKSLYDHNSGGDLTSRDTQRATVVSLDRPYMNEGTGDLFFWDHDLIMFFEREGYDISYATNLDIHRGPEMLLDHKVIVVSGHDEYWSQEMFDAYLAARDSGVHIAALGANNGYWRVEMRTADDGLANRHMACFKYHPDDDAELATILFRDTETTDHGLWGIWSWDVNETDDPNSSIVPVNVDHWFWEGTEAQQDIELPSKIIGYEIDQLAYGFDLPDNSENTLLASSPFNGSRGETVWAHVSLYRSPAGAWIFAAGTNSWGWGLNRPGLAHPALVRATNNLIERMLVDS